MQACERALAAEDAEDEEEDDDDEAETPDEKAARHLLRRLDAGLFTLQLVDYLIGEVCRFHGDAVCQGLFFCVGGWPGESDPARAQAKARLATFLKFKNASVESIAPILQGAPQRICCPFRGACYNRLTSPPEYSQSIGEEGDSPEKLKQLEEYVLSLIDELA